MVLNDNNWHIANTSWKSTGGNVEVWKDGSRDFTSTTNAGSSITSGGCLAIVGEQDAIDGSYDENQTHFGYFSFIHYHQLIVHIFNNCQIVRNKNAGKTKFVFEHIEQV